MRTIETYLVGGIGGSGCSLLSKTGKVESLVKELLVSECYSEKDDIF